MVNYDNIVRLSDERQPVASFFLLILLALMGLFVGQFIAMALIAVYLLVIEQMPFEEGLQLLVTMGADPRIKMPLYFLQALSQVGGFIVAPLLYLRFIEKKSPSLFFRQSINWQAIGLTFLIVISFILVNSVVIEWNSNITFPEYFAPFERWAIQSEEKAKDITVFLTTFENFSQFLVALLVIAVIPAIGEELLFRGLMQNILVRWTSNVHVAIWVTGIIFSAIHFQFFGFVPRVFLGVLFGYMYYWSGNLLVPMFAHFINNGFSLLMLYLYQRKSIDYDLETEQSLPLAVVLTSLVFVIVLLYFFRTIFASKAVVDE